MKKYLAAAGLVALLAIGGFVILQKQEGSSGTVRDSAATNVFSANTIQSGDNIASFRVVDVGPALTGYLPFGSENILVRFESNLSAGGTLVDLNAGTGMEARYSIEVQLADLLPREENDNRKAWFIIDNPEILGELKSEDTVQFALSNFIYRMYPSEVANSATLSNIWKSSLCPTYKIPTCGKNEIVQYQGPDKNGCSRPVGCGRLVH